MSKDFTVPLAEVRLHRGGELKSGDIVRTTSGLYPFVIGLVLHQSESDGGPVIAALDGDRRFEYGRYEKHLCFLRLIESNDLAVSFDHTQLADGRRRSLGALTVLSDDLLLCLDSKEYGFSKPVLISLTSWSFVQPTFGEGQFATVASWSIGRISVGGNFAEVASISGVNSV